MPKKYVGSVPISAMLGRFQFSRAFCLHGLLWRFRCLHNNVVVMTSLGQQGESQPLPYKIYITPLHVVHINWNIRRLQQ